MQSMDMFSNMVWLLTITKKVLLSYTISGSCPPTCNVWYDNGRLVDESGCETCDPAPDPTAVTCNVSTPFLFLLLPFLLFLPFFLPWAFG